MDIEWMGNSKTESKPQELLKKSSGITRTVPKIAS